MESSIPVPFLEVRDPNSQKFSPLTPAPATLASLANKSTGMRNQPQSEKSAMDEYSAHSKTMFPPRTTNHVQQDQESETATYLLQSCAPCTRFRWPAMTGVEQLLRYVGGIQGTDSRECRVRPVHLFFTRLLLWKSAFPLCLEASTKIDTLWLNLLPLSDEGTSPHHHDHHHHHYYHHNVMVDDDVCQRFDVNLITSVNNNFHHYQHSTINNLT